LRFIFVFETARMYQDPMLYNRRSC